MSLFVPGIRYHHTYTNTEDNTSHGTTRMITCACILRSICAFAFAPGVYAYIYIYTAVVPGITLLPLRTNFGGNFFNFSTMGRGYERRVIRAMNGKVKVPHPTARADHDLRTYSNISVSSSEIQFVSSPGFVRDLFVQDLHAWYRSNPGNMCYRSYRSHRSHPAT